MTALNQTLDLPQDAAGQSLAASPCSASCCFNCKHWNGKRRTDKAYCYRLNLSHKDAPHGNAVCVLWEKRINSRMPNAQAMASPPLTTKNDEQSRD